MARTAGRSAEETKRLILQAAARLISRRGSGVPVAEIADAAGVSKGGLLYHFPSKEGLLTELAADLMAQFREQVEQVATEDDGPIAGRLTRAYIRVSFAQGGDFEGLRDHIALAAHLMFEPGLEDLAQQDADRWRDALREDGLGIEVTRLIIAATDGSNSGPLWGAVLSEGDRSALEAHLIALAQPRQGV